MRNPLVKVVVAVLVLLLLIVLAVPLFVNGAALRPTVEDRLSAALHRKVTIASLSFSLFSGSLVAKNLTIAGDPAFSTSPFLKADELRVGVEVAPLLFHRDVRITGLTMDSPTIQLIQNQAGKWNFSNLGATSNAQPSSAGTPNLSVAELHIKNGTATVSSVPPTARPFVYSNINLDAKNFAFTNNFPFNLSATLPASGSLKLTGTAGPISSTDASETPFHANIEIHHLDPVQSGLIQPNKGISALADIAAQVDSNGKTVTAAGKMTAANLQLSPAGSPAPQPVNIDYKITTDLEARTGSVEQLAIHAGQAAAGATGTYRLTPSAIVLDLHLSAPSMPIDPLEALLPAVGIKVPAGSQLKGGTLTADLAITGPATDATIAGPVEIDNTRLAGFDLGSKIQGLSHVSGTSGGTDIQKLSATVNCSPQGTQVSNLYGNLPQIGTATGSGTVSPAGALNFKVVATLNNNNVVGAAANQAINQVTGYLGGLLHGGGQPAASNKPRGIPLTITGTSTNPSIQANLTGIFR